jgi:hypothetical protein
MTPDDALDQIADLLDGREWEVGDLDTIADIVRQTSNYDGSPRVIREPDDDTLKGNEP